MGLHSRAELIWGIPVLAYDENTGEPTRFWDEANEDWREFEGELEVRGYGHYEDPDNQRGILTSTRVGHYSGDCWDPTKIDSYELATHRSNDKLYSKSEDQARANKLDISFYGEAGWWLVADFG